MKSSTSSTTANRVNGRVGMIPTTINPQQNVWQRFSLVNPEGTIIYRPTIKRKIDGERTYFDEDFGSRGSSHRNKELQGRYFTTSCLTG